MNLKTDLAKLCETFQAEVRTLMRRHVITKLTNPTAQVHAVPVASVEPNPEPAATQGSTDKAKAGRPKCSTDGCDRPTYVKGMCMSCYQLDWRKRKAAGLTKKRGLGDPEWAAAPKVPPMVPRKRKTKSEKLAISDVPTEPREDELIAIESQEIGRSPTSKRQPLPSAIKPRFRAILERTKAARAAIDAIIATDEPDPEIDSLPVMVKAPPKLTRAAREAKAKAEARGEDFVPEEPTKHPRRRCGFCHQNGHLLFQCPDRKALITDVAQTAQANEESSIVSEPAA